MNYEKHDNPKPMKLNYLELSVGMVRFKTR